MRVEVREALTDRREAAAGDLGGLVVHTASAPEMQQPPDTDTEVNAPLEVASTPQGTIDSVNQDFEQLRAREKSVAVRYCCCERANGDSVLAAELRQQKDFVLAKMSKNSAAHRAALKERRTSGASRSARTSTRSTSVAPTRGATEYPDRLSGYSL